MQAEAAELRERVVQLESENLQLSCTLEEFKAAAGTALGQAEALAGERLAVGPVVERLTSDNEALRTAAAEMQARARRSVEASLYKLHSLRELLRLDSVQPAGIGRQGW